MPARARLRELLGGDELVVAPGAYDCFTARIVEHAGFPAVYMTGAGTAASLGYPDYGLLTMSEMAANASRIAAAVASPGRETPVTSPLMSDMNTGTPAAESWPAMICRVLVFPVPVAPATSPCRFIIASGSRTVAPVSTSPSYIGRPRITQGSSNA